MKIIIAGSRFFSDYNLLESTVDKITKKLKKGVIISGGAIGADSLGEHWAKTHDWSLEVFLPDYDKYGRKAPLVRNQLMVDGADGLIAFHVRNSSGTTDVIRRAIKRGLKVKVITLV